MIIKISLFLALLALPVSSIFQSNIRYSPTADFRSLDGEPGKFQIAKVLSPTDGMKYYYLDEAGHDSYPILDDNNCQQLFYNNDTPYCFGYQANFWTVDSERWIVDRHYYCEDQCDDFEWYDVRYYTTDIYMFKKCTNSVLLIFDHTQGKCMKAITNYTDYTYLATKNNTIYLAHKLYKQYTVVSYQIDTQQFTDLGIIPYEVNTLHSPGFISNGGKFLVFTFDSVLDIMDLETHSFGPTNPVECKYGLIVTQFEDDSLIAITGPNNQKITKYKITSSFAIVPQGSLDISSITTFYQTSIMDYSYYNLQSTGKVIIKSYVSNERYIYFVIDASDSMSIQEFFFDFEGTLPQLRRAYERTELQFTLTGYALYNDYTKTENYTYMSYTSQLMQTNYSTSNEPGVVYNLQFNKNTAKESQCQLNRFEFSDSSDFKLTQEIINGCPNSYQGENIQILSLGKNQNNLYNIVFRIGDIIYYAKDEQVKSNFSSTYEQATSEAFTDFNLGLSIIVSRSLNDEKGDGLIYNQNFATYNINTGKGIAYKNFQSSEIFKINETSLATVFPSNDNLTHLVVWSNFKNFNGFKIKSKSVSKILYVNNAFIVYSGQSQVEVAYSADEVIPISGFTEVGETTLQYYSNEQFIIKTQNIAFGMSYLIDIPPRKEQEVSLGFLQRDI